MHEVQVEVVGTQCIKRLLQTLGGIGLVRVPQLGGDENLLARDTGIIDALPDLVLILVNERSVNVTVPVLESEGDGFADLSRRRLPGAFGSAESASGWQAGVHTKGNGRDLGTGVEGDVGGDRR